MFGACPCLLLFSYFTHTSTSACLFYMREHCLPPVLISFTLSSSCCRSRDLFFSFKSQFYLVSPSFTLVIGWTVQCYPFWILFLFGMQVPKACTFAWHCGLEYFVEPRWLWFLFCFSGVSQFIGWKIQLVARAESSRHAKLVSDGRSRR